MDNLKNEVKEKTFGYILTALGLVAGLAWNEAIKSAIDVLFPLDKNSILAKFVYAIIITVVVVVLVQYLTKYLSREKEG